MLELLKGASDAEQERILVLEATKLVDSPASEEFDRITRLAAALFQAPISLVSLVTHDRQWFKSKVGLDASETEHEAAFCSHTIRTTNVLVVQDATMDQRFQLNRLVLGEPGIRFYAGAPLITQSGHALGSLCIIDTKPRQWSDAESAQLRDLAALVMLQIERTVSIGRTHEVTHMPNRAQLRSDLRDLASAGDPGVRALALVEIMSAAQVQSALLALGLSALEHSVRVVGQRLSAALGASTTLYHVGETRFAFLLKEEAAIDALDAVMEQMREPFRFGGVAFTLEAYCGALRFNPNQDRDSDVLRMATSALVQASADGAPIRWYEAEVDARHRRAYAWLKALPESLASGEFRLVYQPKMDVAKKRFSGVEALVRWSHPVFGAIHPGEFVPAIEPTAAIHQLTEWVLDAALAQTAAWQRQGLFVTMAVNVSARNLEQPGFERQVAQACERYGVDPKWLHLECTENSVLASDRIYETLKKIERLGIQISLDDFGVGYSNIACLSWLPVSLLKLDRSLIAPIASDFRAWTLAQSLINFGHTLGYRILAEGVEDAATYDMLVSAGCDALQGYFLSKPMEADKVLDFMRTHTFR